MTTSPTTVHLEQLIRDLNNPYNQGLPYKIHEIQKQIQQLQRQPSAWQAGLDLLEHAEPHLRFYGALTLTIKVNADWENDKIGEDRDSLRGLLKSLVLKYVRLAAAGDATFVLQKLCTTLVAVFQKNDSAWALPIRHVLACSIAGNYLEQTQTPELDDLFALDSTISAASLRAVLLLAQTLAEEADTASHTGRSLSLQVRMSNNSSDVWHLLHYSTTRITGQMFASLHEPSMTSQLRIGGTTEQLLEIGHVVLQIAPHWTNDIKVKPLKIRSTDPIELIDRFLDVVAGFLQLYSHQFLSAAVVQALTALEQTSHTLLHRGTSRYAEQVVRSQQAALWVNSLLAGDFDADAIAYVEFLEAFMSQVDVTTPEYLQYPQHIEILEQVQRLLVCDGIAGIEDLVCHVALETLSPVVEGFCDWPGSSPFDTSIKTLVAASCSACLSKIRMPPQELGADNQTWFSDDRARFQDFRFDVQDFLQNAFVVLGVSLVEEIVRSLLMPENLSQWHVFEADLFGLTAFADVMATEPGTYDPYLQAVFGCPNWFLAIDSTRELPERVRQMTIKVIGESTGFLQRHTQNLVSSLNFLFEALHTAVLATPASRAIFTLCDSQRVMLTETLGQFITSLSTVSDLEPDVRNRIFGGVSAIIQALPTERTKLEPLSQVLMFIETDIQQALDNTIETHEFRSKASGAVYTLAAIGKGLRAPSDAPEDPDLARSEDINFWISGIGSSVQQSALRIYRILQEKTNLDEDSTFVEATCEFLRSTFTEDHPSPFRFPSETMVSILDRHIHFAVLQPDLVMGTISSYLASADIKDPNNGFDVLSSSTVRVCEDAMREAKAHASTQGFDFCAASLEFYARLLPKWGKVWLSSSRYQDQARVLLEITLVLIKDPDTMTRRSASSFCSAFFDASARNYIKSDQQAASKMNTSLQEHGPQLLANLIHLLGGECARSELDSITEPLKRFVQKQPLMANRLIKEAMKAENAVLSSKALTATKPELRARVAAQIEMLRGARKTNEIMKDFWIACRGSSFGYVV